MPELSISDAISLLEENNFTVKFEGNISVKMMPMKLSDFEKETNLTKKENKLAMLRREISFFQRPEKEKLLRLIIFQLFDVGYLDKSKSIIDIGCWLGDNAIPWSFLISDNSVVHAIDPSDENLNFAKNIALINGRKNLNWVKAVCSETVGEKLNFQGSIEQANFNVALSSETATHISNSLDNIINSSSYKSISLIHVDVEGFEERTLRGAKKIITNERPVIVFEQHISSDKTRELIQYLVKFEYKIFMVNEILPGCKPDCRNFIAFDRRKSLPKMPKLIHSEGRRMNIFYATLDEALIDVS